MAKILGGLLIVIGLGMLAMGAVNYLGYGLGLDGNTPIVAVGLMFLFLGWLKFGDKPKTEGEAASSIADNDRKR
jgi:hypothetical protein